MPNGERKNGTFSLDKLPLWVVLAALTAFQGAQGFQLIRSERTPDDVFQQQGKILDVQAGILSKLGALETAIANARPDPFTGTEGGQVQAEIREIKSMIAEINTSLGLIREFIVTHEIRGHADQGGP
ncbi:MAG: hypothetical protein ACR2QF_02465 [Geminicoccaceae bacterium]